tara:strand:+ start:484 stop:1110 length:627 start_codon:yes stop_codon:yes gene_type:complete
MPKATGFSALAALTTFTAKKWFTKSFVDLVEDISRLYGKRSEIIYGTAWSYGSGAADNDELKLDNSAGAVMLNGVLTDVAAATNTDIFTNAIWSDGNGNDDVGFDLGASTTAKISLIYANSDANGSTQTTPRLVAIVAGTGNGAGLGSDFLTTAQINSALAASSGEDNGYNHSGTTHWIHVARVTYARDGSAGYTTTVSDNRNNIAGV